MRFLSSATLVAALVATSSDAFTPVNSRHTVVLPKASVKAPKALASSLTNSDQQATNIVSLSSSSSSNSDSVDEVAPFENDGGFAWMQPFLKVVGFEQGRELYGAIPLPVSEMANSMRTDEAESARLRAQAAADMVNIGTDERQRRDTMGTVFAGITILYSMYATFADQGDTMGHVLRFATIVPLFLAAGFKLSAQRGLCNVAQAGLWDVGDGKGLTPVDDPSLARALLEKVNDMNVDTAVKCLVPTAMFAALQHSSAVALVLSGLTVGALYAVNGKVPSVVIEEESKNLS